MQVPLQTKVASTSSGNPWLYYRCHSTLEEFSKSRTSVKCETAASPEKRGIPIIKRISDFVSALHRLLAVLQLKGGFFGSYLTP
jgi:VanZ family protein